MQRGLRRAHGRIWMVFAFLLPVVLITLVSLRQTEPLDRPAVLISSPAEDGASQ